MMKPNLSRAAIVCVLATCFTLLCSYPTKAQTLIDPSTLHIGAGAGTACALGCAGDPNLIGSGNTVDVSQTSAGADTLKTPLFLILAVPNDTTNLFVTDPISGVSFINPYPGGTTVTGTAAFAAAGTYGLKAAVADGFFGTMTSGQVYGFLGLNENYDSSNSFVNFTAADLSHDGITATGYGIYVFALSGGELGPGGLANVTFNSGSLPLGTVVIAYGQTSKMVYDNAFTEAGMTAGTTTTPEPASMLLIGTGLVAFGGLLRRRKQASA